MIIFFLLKFNMEELEKINNYRPPEIHTVILWNALKHGRLFINYIKTNKYFKSKFKILLVKKISLNNKQQNLFCNKIYNIKINKVINGSIYLLVINDFNPIYKYEKATSCFQVLNYNMKLLKEDMRLKIGGSKKNYNSIHTSYNIEESNLVLDYFKIKLYKRPTFTNYRHFFKFLNKNKKLKYCLLLYANLLENNINNYNNFSGFKNIKILVNDYYYFKSITGAKSIFKDQMRENDNKSNVENLIKINNKEIQFNIRYIGDNYFDHNWQKNALNSTINYKIKNFFVKLPNEIDEFYIILYHEFVHKKPLNKKYYQKLKNVGNKIIKNFDINNYKKIYEILNKFIKNKNYKIVKANDINVKFYNKYP